MRISPWRCSLAGLAVVTCLSVPGCDRLLTAYFADTLPAPSGTEQAKGLQAQVKIGRDSLGIPLIEAQNDDDLAFAMGYVAAEDRLSQMIGFKMIAAGRLAEIGGKPLLDIDFYLRCINLNKAAQLLYEAASPRTRRILQRYAEGVNAFVASHKLPPDLQLTGYTPDPWQPQDSVRVLALVNLQLALNAREELVYLQIAQKLGAERAAWLMPIYPDEPLPFAEARKLAGVDLSAGHDALKQLSALQLRLDAVGQRPVAASNNWAVHGSRTAEGAAILANDTHLPLSMPSPWHYLHAKAPGYDAAGVALPGAPGVLLGFNGRLAWGATAVMGDNQDIFLEELQTIAGKLHYRKGDEWLPTMERMEVFSVKGAEPVTRTFHETRHGPLLNSALSTAFGPEAIPTPIDTRYGLAFSWPMLEGDRTLDGLLGIARAQSVAEATPILQEIRAIALNYVYADRGNIAWQVTGRFPLRKNGRGKLPSPGWSGEYDWTGYLPVAEHPAKINPPEGFVATANQRTVPADFPRVLSSSWFYPERAERIDELLSGDRRHTLRATQAMQYDQHSRLAGKLRQVLLQRPIVAAIEQLPEETRKAAGEALKRLTGFAGDMEPDSGDAALFSAFLHRFAIRTFGDELGYPDDPVWKAFLTLGPANYSAIQDHLLQRDDSPFWDDVSTPPKESKSQVIAAALADSIALLEGKLGKDRGNWQWGRLHTYFWETDDSKVANLLGGWEKFAYGLVAPFFNHGPLPAGGDHTTLNVATYTVGGSFDTVEIPAMRLVVDFSQAEPMLALNSSGQSGNPANRHYLDGIGAWLTGRYQPFPFHDSAIVGHYRQVKTLRP